MFIICTIAIILCILIPLIYFIIDRVRHGWFDGEILAMGYVIAIMIAIIPVVGLMPLVQVSLGEKNYTGVIYSVENVLNKTVGHIRFSENAGEDTQPSFCVVKDSAEADKLRMLVGSGKKVKVTVPAGVSVQMWYGECGLPATIEEMQ